MLFIPRGRRLLSEKEFVDASQLHKTDSSQNRGILFVFLPLSLSVYSLFPVSYRIFLFLSRAGLYLNASVSHRNCQHLLRRERFEDSFCRNRPRIDLPSFGAVRSGKHRACHKTDRGGTSGRSFSHPANAAAYKVTWSPCHRIYDRK